MRGLQPFLVKSLDVDWEAAKRGRRRSGMRNFMVWFCGERGGKGDDI